MFAYLLYLHITDKINYSINLLNNASGYFNCNVKGRNKLLFPDTVIITDEETEADDKNCVEQNNIKSIAMVSQAKIQAGC